MERGSTEACSERKGASQFARNTLFRDINGKENAVPRSAWCPVTRPVAPMAFFKSGPNSLVAQLKFDFLAITIQKFVQF